MVGEDSSFVHWKFNLLLKCQREKERDGYAACKGPQICPKCAMCTVHCNVHCAAMCSLPPCTKCCMQYAIANVDCNSVHNVQYSVCKGGQTKLGNILLLQMKFAQASSSQSFQLVLPFLNISKQSSNCLNFLNFLNFKSFQSFFNYSECFSTSYYFV